VTARSGVGAGRIWLRTLLFGALAAPLLGGLLTAAAVILVRSQPPPSVAIVVATAVSVSYVVTTVPALLAAILCTSLALRWERRGLSRARIALSLAGVGAVLGMAAALAGACLAGVEACVRPEYLVPGALTGLLVGVAFPRVLRGRP
jgi:hypothetical protein